MEAADWDGSIMSARLDTSFEHDRKGLRHRLRDAPDDTTVLIAERAGPPAFPPVCPKCGQTAQTVVPVRKAFGYSSEDQGTIRSVDEYRVLFCDGCARQHASEQKPLSPWVPVLRILKGDGSNIGGLFICGVGLFFLSEAVKTLSPILLAFSALPWLVGGWLVRATWTRNRYLTVSPPTSISSTVDFSPDLAQAHESPWRAFYFQSPPYASRFREANAARLWDIYGAEARAAREKRRSSSRRTMWVVGLIFGAAFVWWFWDEVLSPHWVVIRQWLP